MRVLGIETSTEVCGVCLLSENGMKVERSLVEARIHSEKLLTLVQEVFAEAQEELKDISAVAVSIGPGSFTGLRIGLSSAKGLCYALGKPLIIVPTFNAIAESARRSGSASSKLAIALDAKQGEYYIAEYSNTKGRYQCKGEVEVLPAARVKEILHSFGAGLMITDTEAVWKRELGNGVQFRNYREYCRAESVAHLGLEKFRAKDTADLASTEPMYLKDFVVKSTK